MAAAAYAFGLTAPLGARRCSVNQSVASKSSALSFPASLLDAADEAKPGVTPRSATAAHAASNENRRIFTPLERHTRRAMDNRTARSGAAQSWIFSNPSGQVKLSDGR